MNAQSGSVDWIKHYLTVVTHVILKLSREEHAEVQQTLDEWEAVRPPNDMKSVLISSTLPYVCILLISVSQMTLDHFWKQ